MTLRAVCRLPFRLASPTGFWYNADMKGSLMGRGDCGVGGANVEAGPMAERDSPPRVKLRNEPNFMQAGVEKVILESQKRTQIWPPKRVRKGTFEVDCDRGTAWSRLVRLGLALVRLRGCPNPSICPTC